MDQQKWSGTEWRCAKVTYGHSYTLEDTDNEHWNKCDQFKQIETQVTKHFQLLYLVVDTLPNLWEMGGVWYLRGIRNGTKCFFVLILHINIVVQPFYESYFV